MLADRGECVDGAGRLAAERVMLELGTVVRLADDVETPLGRVPAGTVGEVVNVHSSGPDAAPLYEIAVPVSSGILQLSRAAPADTDVLVEIPPSALMKLTTVELLLERARHPRVGRRTQLLEVIRSCWRCDQTHALRYEVQLQLPVGSKEYDCPYCSARQEERARFADGVDVRLAVFPRGRPTSG
jgi:hypothetical protein